MSRRTSSSNQQLTELGELSTPPTGSPDQAKVVMSDGATSPVITDGPFPESKELLAGYRLVQAARLACGAARPALNG